MLLLLVEGAWLFGSLTHNYVRVWVVCAEMTTRLIAGTDKHVLFDQDVSYEMKLLLDCAIIAERMMEHCPGKSSAQL